LLKRIKDVLGEAGYRVVVSKINKSAHHTIQQRKPDLIFLDLGLAHAEEGWALLDLLQLSETTCAIPTILSSVDTTLLQAKESHLRTLGCTVLERPFRAEALVHLVQALCPPQQPDAPASQEGVGKDDHVPLAPSE